MSKDDLTAGYGGEDKDDETLWQYWRLERMIGGVHSGVMGQVVVNDHPRGIIHLKDEAEFEWLKKRVTGERERKV